MKYKKLCSFLCVMLALQPQNILADENQAVSDTVQESQTKEVLPVTQFVQVEENSDNGDDKNGEEGLNSNQGTEESGDLVLQIVKGEADKDGMEGIAGDADKPEDLPESSIEMDINFAQQADENIISQEQQGEQAECMSAEPPSEEAGTQEETNDEEPNSEENRLESLGPIDETSENPVETLEDQQELENLQRKDTTFSENPDEKKIEKETAKIESTVLEKESPLQIQEPEKKEIPVIKVEQVLQFSSNADTVKPLVYISDAGVDTERFEMILESKEKGVLNQVVQGEIVNGELRYQLPEILEDDRYVLKIVDRMNEGEIKQQITFSVNQSGTLFSYEEETEELAVTNDFSPIIQMENVDTTEIISCMVNGREATYHLENGKVAVDREFLTEGKNQITMAVQDMAGNISVMTPWEFSINSELEGAEYSMNRTEKMEQESLSFTEQILWFFENLIPKML